jgi:hypothetical protein
MSREYKFTEKDGAYFVSFSTINWNLDFKLTQLIGNTDAPEIMGIMTVVF